MDLQQKSDQEPELINSIIQEIMLSNERMSNSLLQIAGLSSEFNITDVLANQDRAQKLFDTASQTLPKLLTDCSFETKGTQFLTQVKWSQGLLRATFTSNSCLCLQKELEDKLNKLITDPKKAPIKTVSVKIIDIIWVL